MIAFFQRSAVYFSKGEQTGERSQETGREHMSDQHEQGPWGQDEVEIIDLDVPDKGLSRYVFTLGERWHAAASLRARLVALVIAFGLLIAVLQPGSSGVNTRTPGSLRTVPRSSFHFTIYILDCVAPISISGPPGQAITWHRFVSTPTAQEWSFSIRPGSQCLLPQQLIPTPSSQEVVIGCSVRTPLPVRSGKDGKRP